MIGRVIVLAWVSVFFTATFASGESPQNPKAVVGAKAAQRSLTAIHTDVRAALTAEAKTRPTGNNTPEVLRLADLYREMAAHPQHDTSMFLKELGQQVRSRLFTVRDRIERRTGDSKRSGKNQKVSPAAGPPDTRVLAQQLPPPNAGDIRQGVAQGAMVTGIPRATGLPTDLGPELVELIEATISPSTWNVNGGRGAVVYYSPLHVLVVAAPQEVQEQVGSVLRQLQVAQRQMDGTQVVAEVGVVDNKN